MAAVAALCHGDTLLPFQCCVLVHGTEALAAFMHSSAPQQKVMVPSSTESRVPAILCGAIPKILATITVATMIMY